MKRYSGFLLVLTAMGVFIAASMLSAREKPGQKTAPNPAVSYAQIEETQTLWNINNIAGWIRNDGYSGNNPYIGNWGVWYPRGTAGVIFQDGLVWGGKVTQSHWPQPQGSYRVGGQTYRIGTLPGHIIQAGTPTTPPVSSNPNNAYIYRIRADWQNLTVNDPEVIQDAAELNNVDTSQVTPAMAQAVLDDYEWAWNNWPGDLGAPFYDLNGNNQWDPGTDEPGLADADQVIWFVCNDLNPGLTTNLYGSQPIGLELQVAMWGYHQPGTTIGQASFRRYRLINKSGFPIDSMFIAQWSDSDIGYFGDDFGGCDSLTILGYAYNGNPEDTEFQQFGLPPAAVGYALLQGPIIPSPGDTATFNFHKLPGYKNLSMTSFGYFAAGSTINDPNLGEYSGTLQWYNLLNGFIPTADTTNPTPYTHGVGPLAGRPTKFPLNGDPVAMAGDIDGLGSNLPPGDRRIVVSSGPFTMLNGDVQEMVLAIIGGITPGPGGNNRTAVAQLKLNSDFIRLMWDDISTGIAQLENPVIPEHLELEQNYPNPFNPATIIRYHLSVSEFVTLKVYDILGREVATLVNERQITGIYRVPFIAADLASGVYVYRITAGGFSKSRKMVLLR
ncbi:MAG: T9SS type A sorting domain-containing protein [Calditrichaceae bacterium]|nr:T9SS type A sorting domain-containing protein [Calditrichia bacterium]NUQ40714.1 T9SS type A sorting domain-containing protein [Calditrichaceae bacterium]